MGTKQPTANSWLDLVSCFGGAWLARSRLLMICFRSLVLMHNGSGVYAELR